MTDGEVERAENHWFSVPMSELIRELERHGVNCDWLDKQVTCMDRWARVSCPSLKCAPSFNLDAFDEPMCAYGRELRAMPEVPDELRDIYNRANEGYFVLVEAASMLADEMDVARYVSPEYDSNQMYEIVLGHRSGVDVSEYDLSDYGWRHMEEIRENLEAKADAQKSGLMDLPMPELEREFLSRGVDEKWLRERLDDIRESWVLIDYENLTLNGCVECVNRYIEDHRDPYTNECPDIDTFDWDFAMSCWPQRRELEDVCTRLYRGMSWNGAEWDGVRRNVDGAVEDNRSFG